MLVSCLTCSSMLKMKASCSSETSVDFRRTIWRYIPEGRTLHNRRCENLKSYKVSGLLTLYNTENLSFPKNWRCRIQRNTRDVNEGILRKCSFEIISYSDRKYWEEIRVVGTSRFPKNSLFSDASHKVLITACGLQLGVRMQDDHAECR
jgi:hypothetical protein